MSPEEEVPLAAPELDPGLSAEIPVEAAAPTRVPPPHTSRAPRWSAWLGRGFLSMVVLLIIWLEVVPLLVGPMLEGREAPDFEIEDIDGNIFQLSDHRGEVVVIAFMASYCEPCKAEHDDLKRAQSSQNLTIISISVYPLDTDEVLREYRDEFDIPWTMAKDDLGDLRARYGATGTPRTVIIDTGGEVHAAHTGLIPYADLLDELDGARS